MKKPIWLVSLLVALISTAAGAAEPGAAPTLAAKDTLGDASGQAQFAWQLFVYAMRPTNGALQFETWTEQCQINPNLAGCPSPSQLAAAKGGRTLHGSALAHSAAKNKVMVTGGASDSGIICNGMQTSALGGVPAPANLSKTAQFCEEVYANPPERDFIVTNKLITLNGQQAYAKANGGAITFPWDAIEVKADWVPASSFTNAKFTCPDTSNQLYTETINGTCYALVGVHISSKILPDWVWATFEPASSITNPNRCNPKLYDTCFDPWGTTSANPYGPGSPVKQSPALGSLMSAAGLNKAFNNYFLTGVQTQFVDAGNKPIPLGNSFVEFNAGVLPGQASCITCHKYAYYDSSKPSSPENNFGGPPNGWTSVGYACNKPNPTANCTPVVANSISQDFSWMLGLMPVN